MLKSQILSQFEIVATLIRQKQRIYILNHRTNRKKMTLIKRKISRKVWTWEAA